MGRIYILLCLCMFMWNGVLGQQLDTIPDLSYWNMSYSSRYTYEKRNKNKEDRVVRPPDFSGLTTFPLESKPLKFKVEQAKLEIQQALKNQDFKGIKFNRIDSNCIQSLVFVQHAFPRNSYISLDYWDKGDASFKMLLTYLYTASITQNAESKKDLLQKSKKIGDRISRPSLPKAISFIYTSMVEYSMKDIEGFYDGDYLEAIDSVANRLAGDLGDNNKAKSVLNEVLGDFWSYYTWTGKSYGYYTDALNFSRKISNDSVSFLLQKRITTKLNHVQYSLADVNLFDNYSLLHSIWNADLDIYHYNYVIAILSLSGQYEANRKDSIEVYKALTQFSDPNISAPHNFTPEDALTILEKVELAGVAINDREMCQNSFSLYLDILGEYNLIRNRDFFKVAEFQFLLSLRAKNFVICHQVNDIILKYAEKENRYYWQQFYHINEALLSVSQNDFNKAREILTGLTAAQGKRQQELHLYFPHRGIARGNQLCEIVEYQCEMVLQYIAKCEGDIYKYIYYQNISTSYKPDFWNEKQNITNFYIKKDRNALVDVYTYKLLVSKQMRDQDSAALFAQTQRVMISDSLRISQRKNDSLLQSITSGLLKAEKEKVQSETNKEWGIGIVSFSAFIILFSFGTIYYRAEQDKSKSEQDRLRSEQERVKLTAESEKRKLEAEAAILELESLRAPYLNHAIGDNFQHIINRITIGMQLKDSGQLLSAIKIAKAQSVLFTEIIENATGVTSLKQEIEHNIKYVDLMSLCVGNSIQCETNVNWQLLDKITVPSYFLLDIFINAVTHGKLSSVKNPRIIVTLTEQHPVYILTIVDNGVGLSQSRNETKDRPSTGLDRVSKRLTIFNKSNAKSIFYFNKLFNVEELFSEKKSCGTCVTIQIELKDGNFGDNS